MSDRGSAQIVITGSMGVGKTTVGRLLAEELGVVFLDSDEMLEARSGGMNAAEIAAREGVDALHEMELAVFLEMCEVDTESVLAPATSVVDDPRGRSELSGRTTVWLTAPDHVVAVRQGSGGHRRPLDVATRRALRAKRERHFEAVSTMKVETGSSTPDEVVAHIIERL